MFIVLFLIPCLVFLFLFVRLHEKGEAKHLVSQKKPKVYLSLSIVFLILTIISIPLSAKNSSSERSQKSSSSASNDDDNDDDSSSSSSESSKKLNLADYKTGVSYKDISSNEYAASNVAFPARVIEINDDLSVLVAMDNNENEKIMVNIPAENIYENKISEGEIITAYGMDSPKQNFKTKNFGKIKVPVLMCDKVNVGLDSNVISFYSSSSSSSESESSSSSSVSEGQQYSSSVVSSSSESVDNSQSSSSSVETPAQATTDTGDTNNDSGSKWAIEDGFTWATRKGHSRIIAPGQQLPAGYHWEK